MPRGRLALGGALIALCLLLPAGASAQSGGSVQPRIVGGSTASTSTYPWQAAVAFSQSQYPSLNAHERQFCGGSLITSRIVMTAAHCVYDTDPDCSLLCAINDPSGDGTAKLDPNDVDVVLGRTTLSGSDGAEIPVQAVSYRSNYNPDYQGDGVPRFDVAYLVLAAGSGQAQIKIAGPDEGALWDAGSPAIVSGWGTTSDSNGAKTQDTLRAAQVSVIDDATCSNDYAILLGGSDFDPQTMLCAGTPSGADACFGDSGGPLEAPIEGGGDRLVGVVGWGEGCGDASFPGVYTRVAGSTVLPLIESDVGSLESTYGLPAEGVVGSGALPLGSGASSAHPFAKCKRIHNKRKRKRCIKKVKRKLAAG
jgi:secreted trypsin-like serine protease